VTIHIYFAVHSKKSVLLEGRSGHVFIFGGEKRKHAHYRKQAHFGRSDVAENKGFAVKNSLISMAFDR
jgi:hypothetical protein